MYSSKRDRKERRHSHRDQDRERLPLDQAEDTRIEAGMSEQEIEQRIRLRIVRRAQMRNEFFGHLITFVIVNIVLWLIYLAGATFSIGFINGIPFIGNIPWPLFVTFFWGIGLVSHGFYVYQNSGNAMARREQALRDEVEREKTRLGLAGDNEKPKRSQDVRLSDDGELVPIDELLDDDDAEMPKAKRGSLS